MGKKRTRPELTPEKKKWVTRLRAVGKNRRNRVIQQAHDVGGLSFQEVADHLGDVKRGRVVQIVMAEREKSKEPPP